MIPIDSNAEWLDRTEMVDQQIRARGIRDDRVIDAMLRVPRSAFVDATLHALAYDDHPLPIGDGQTISQPYMVALMTAALRLHGSDRVLEIGAGSGYQTAILAELCREVFSVERVAALAERASAVLARLGYGNVHLRVADGSRGWPEEAPFDAILVAAGAPAPPEALVAQLAAGGRLVLPIGNRDVQELVRITRPEVPGAELTLERLGACRFVPLVGDGGWHG